MLFVRQWQCRASGSRGPGQQTTTMGGVGGIGGGGVALALAAVRDQTRERRRLLFLYHPIRDGPDECKNIYDIITKL